MNHGGTRPRGVTCAAKASAYGQNIIRSHGPEGQQGTSDLCRIHVGGGNGTSHSVSDLCPILRPICVPFRVRFVSDLVSDFLGDFAAIEAALSAAAATTDE